MAQVSLNSKQTRVLLRYFKRIDFQTIAFEHGEDDGDVIIYAMDIYGWEAKITIDREGKAKSFLKTREGHNEDQPLQLEDSRE